MELNFEFETQDGLLLRVSASVSCRSLDDGAEYDEVWLEVQDGTGRSLETTDLTDKDAARLDKELFERAQSCATDAYQEYLESAGDAYHDSMQDRED